MRHWYKHLARSLRATKITVRRLIVVALLCTLALNLSTSGAQSVLEQVQKEGILRMITFVGPTTYFEDARGPNGFEYLLAKAFADHLGVNLEVHLIENLDALFHAVGGPRGHFAGAGLTITEQRKKRLLFSTPYKTVRQALVYRMGDPRPSTIEDLIGGRLVAVANSSHTEHLKQLTKNHPDLRWQALRDTEMLDLMQMVHEGQADYAVVDSSAYALNRSLYPKARTGFYLTDEQAVAWVFPDYEDTSLLKAANLFLEKFSASGKLARLKARIYDHTDSFSVAGSQLFMRRIDQRLAKFRPMFERAARDYDLDWRLLASMAYQESHWNPKAKSPTGVRGMMMLTRDTARELGVENRLSPEQSIRGGTRYFVEIRERLPESIKEPDRTWFALAAYNVGMGHLEDARVLTQRHKGNPNLWRDVREYLPLLQQKKYHATVKHGYARGNEPVRYVKNIRHFRSILQWHDIQQVQREALAKEAPTATNHVGGSLSLPL
ncbi:MAG TPA: membrane-bound lytic murein transglycosylase MltF [Porticoccaceae bacterium]|nr:membrane-bound lytic murein transglycosylase MltF [Porticoccaceae bacterium]